MHQNGAPAKNGLDHRFGQTRTMGRPRQGVFGSPASCLSDGEFLPGWESGRNDNQSPKNNEIGPQKEGPII